MDKTVWGMLFYVLVRIIWKTRNEVVFEGAIFNWKVVADLIRIRLGLWVKAKKEELDYS